MINVVALVAREHGLNGLLELERDKRVKVKAIFTHRNYPKLDTNQGERGEFKRFELLAKRMNAPLYTIDKASEKQVLENFIKNNKDIDLLVSISWRYLVPENLLSSIKYGGINLHRGKLPNYKGALPIVQAIDHNEKEVIITAHKMIDEIDEGEIIEELSFPFIYDASFSKNKNVELIKSQITGLFGVLLKRTMDKLIEE